MSTLRLHSNFQGMTGAITIEGIVDLCEGRTQQALSRLRDALEMGEQHEDLRRVAYIRCFLAVAALGIDDSAQATVQIMKGLRWFYESGDRCGLALALEVCAVIAAERGDLNKSAQLTGASESLRFSLGAPVPPAYLALFDRYLANSRSIPREDAFRVAQAAGASLSLSEIVSLASLLAP